MYPHNTEHIFILIILVLCYILIIQTLLDIFRQAKMTDFPQITGSKLTKRKGNGILARKRTIYIIKPVKRREDLC